MPKKPDLSVIILNYNTKDLLRECLESVNVIPASRAGRRDMRYEVIVVDNASTDGSVEEIKNLKFKIKNDSSKLKIISNKENLGFAAGNNVGIKKAQGRYLLFLNPDTIVPPENFKIMLKFMDKNPKVGAATCRVELPNGQLDYSCHRGFPTPWNAFAYFSGLAKFFPKVKLLNGYTLTYLSLNETHEIDAASGAYLVVRREAGEKVGWWDEDYFWYGEDLDLCYRLKQRGWKIMFVPKTKIIHYKGVASGLKKQSQKISTATRETRRRAAKASIEVMRIFYQKHYRDKYPKLIFWLVMCGIDLLEKIRLFKLRSSL